MEKGACTFFKISPFVLYGRQTVTQVLNNMRVNYTWQYVFLYFSGSVKDLKHLYCVVSADTHLSTTSISKQKRLSIESVFLLIQDFSLNFSVGFDMTPFCEKRETDSEDLMQTAPLSLQMTETWASLYLLSCGFCLCVAHAEDVAAFFVCTIMACPCTTQRPWNTHEMCIRHKW